MDQKNNTKNIKLLPGKKYSFCTCGLSTKLPFCDVAHRAYNEKNATNYVSFKVEVSSETDASIVSATWKS
jgi:CDGSH-type Zn-finger protein